ncbi:MAG TPA: CARDB domain-containing protein [Methanofastidiosum sp.]|nr:CARDB domain-containing protein [Methanofastidiosum sp.]HPX23837.1 CARDB domain-containing protein [Methanofastidiosum sp.]HQC24598.1 CARDB domain-containing protein [Methanofastidiosum sp.]
MKRVVILALMLFLIIKPVMAEYIDISLSYPTTIEKGDEISITFEIINKSNDRLWDGTIAIEEPFMSKYGSFVRINQDNQKYPFKFSIIEPGERVKKKFEITFEKDIPLKELKFNIVLKCGKGACRGGCRPFYLEKPITISIIEKRAEATLNLDVNEYSAYKGETIEVPFTVRNNGQIQITNAKVEVKGDLISDETVKIPFINSGDRISDKIRITIDNNSDKTQFNPLIILKFQDPTGKEVISYKTIAVRVMEKENILESNDSEIDSGNVNENVNKPPPSLFYFFVVLAVVAIIAFLIIIIYIFKR